MTTSSFFSAYAADEVVRVLQSVFGARDLGQATNALGMQLVYDRTARTLHLSQPRLIIGLLERCGMSGARQAAVSAAHPSHQPHTHRAWQGAGHDTTRYAYSAVVGSLQYIAVCTPPDLAYTAGMLGRHSANPAPVSHSGRRPKEPLRYLPGGAHGAVPCTAAGP